MKYIFSITILGIIFQTSIYSYSVSSSEGIQISFEQFRGKKILLVNIATGSPAAGQLGQLQQLQQQFKDSLIVIGFPSNSFGNEPRSNAEIKTFCQQEYGVSFLIAAKGGVAVNDMQPVYQWLTMQEKNGATSSEVKQDFQKYVIDQNGELLGAFAGTVSPLSNQIINTITGQ